MNFEKVITIDGQEQVVYSVYTIEDELGVIVDMYLYNEILQPSYYTHFFQIIRDLQPNDNINIYINSPGGDFTTLLAFEQAISTSEAKVNCYVTGEAASAAGVLAFMGDNIILSDFATIMLHNIQTITDGDSSDITKSLVNTSSIYKMLLQKYCTLVLSDSDIDDIIENGKTFYFTSQNMSMSKQPENPEQNPTEVPADTNVPPIEPVQTTEVPVVQPEEPAPVVLTKKKARSKAKSKL